MKRFFKLIVIIFTFLVCFSCDEEENESLLNSSNIISIEYGTSFGECLGYCIQSIEITGTSIEYSAIGWTTIDKVPDIHISGEISLEDWDEIINKIDVVVFHNLDEVIGCPDCADGGAEWIEITTDKFIHKVTFEYNNEPKEVKNYIDDLRSVLEQYLDQLN